MNNKKTSTSNKVLTIIGSILCVILIPILVINITLIAKSYINKNEVPSIGNMVPLIVLTDSMRPKIDSGDLIICQKIDPEDVNKRNIISFIDPAGNGTSIVTHRVIDIFEENGELFFVTKGDYNNDQDKEPVPAKNLVGIYKTKLPGLGHVAMFMQSTTGLIICVILPIILLVGYDVVRRRIYEKGEKEDTAALLAELEVLRAEKAEKEKEKEASNADNSDNSET